jgi:glucose-1-phosphate adenylyltransferase
MAKNAEVTVACNNIDPEYVHHFGIMGLDADSKICKFVEKPKNDKEISDLVQEKNGRRYFMGSMGIYLFNKDVLIDLLMKNTKIDFGREVIPDAIRSRSTYAYVYDGYWRDIGTIETFYSENLSLADAMPPMNIFDEEWQIFTRPRHLAPAKYEHATIERSIVAEGAILLSAKVVHSVIGLRFRISSGTMIEDTIAMGCDYYQTMGQLQDDASKGIPHLGVGKNCTIRKAILDKNVRIGDNVRIVNEKNLKELDGDNYYIRDGIVIIPKSAVIPSGTVI